MARSRRKNHPLIQSSLPQQRQISAIVLDRENRGENSLFITAYSLEEGLVFLFKRMSSKKTSLAPDLFDEISALVQFPESEAPVKFLQQFDIVAHRSGISTSYDKLCSASDIASIVKQNGANISETASLYNLLSQSLGAVETHKNTSAVKLKFLYLLVKEQGYAIREDFFSAMSAQDKEAFSKILKTPIAELDESTDICANLYEALRRWSAGNTDFVF